MNGINIPQTVSQESRKILEDLQNTMQQRKVIEDTRTPEQKARERAMIKQENFARWKESVRPEPNKDEISIPPRYNDKDLTIKNSYCLDWVKNWNTMKPPMIQGPTGSGKTHLLWSIVRKLSDIISNRYQNQWAEITQDDYEKKAYSLDQPYPSIVLVSSVEMFHRIKRGINTHSDSRIMEQYQQEGILMLDDFGLKTDTPWISEQLYLILDHRYNYCKPTLIATNFSIKEIAELNGQRIASRLMEMCHPIEIVGKDWRVETERRS